LASRGPKPPASAHPAVRFLSDEDVIGNNFTNADRTTNSQIIIISPVGYCSQQEKIGT
jgi:hypothetical protein